VMLHRRPGDRVSRGDVLYELRADDVARIPDGLAAAAGAVTVAATPPSPEPLVRERIA
jgi:thymidine phosphorylase